MTSTQIFISRLVSKAVSLNIYYAVVRKDDRQMMSSGSLNLQQNVHFSHVYQNEDK